MVTKKKEKKKVGKRYNNRANRFIQQTLQKDTSSMLHIRVLKTTNKQQMFYNMNIQTDQKPFQK